MSTPKPPRRKSALALRYNSAKDRAPRVTAKGQGEVAERIMALARAHGIPMREDPDLIQALSQLDLQHEIPPSLYHVVAEILAFVYRLNNDYRSLSS